ncbi:MULTISPECIES: 1-phosphofructokinase [Clostridium]|uniref:Tagatose-6-phosphate kinase n=2 Tax=Clostridium TaxID=1485 RepID=A0A151AKR2_9CLOT|nr:MULTISPECIES: 1-phosphofructokinase [Clostridium]KYH28223.1 tagatose-6-phosphate kinase [Clostridium colicanis DSM 13634]MBE6044296.1 1-phosphofructokinase [Clostridium thermopalmarium]PRR76573.1 Tagatose-6-phosphate kinase [Clostridium thermopalmarium DSM 5974]PVZ28314.1 1-phosphofructokinase [Clostridium thermopalmarium DSM 5974]
MIYTVTFNPSVDYIVEVENFVSGTVNRVKEDHKYPGGKGINVSRVLNNLGVKSKALGFIGGFTGEYIKSTLESQGIDTDFITVNEDTRINIKLKSNEETEINGVGPKIENEKLNELFNKLGNLNSEDFLVLAGNVQKTLPRDIYAQIQKKCLDTNVNVIVDTTGEALLNSLKYKPFLIKPNNHELAEIFETEINTRDEIIYYGKKLMDMGAQNVIISMAGEGALLICREGVYHASAPKGEVKNSVGAGDSMIGGFLAKYSKDTSIVEAFRWGAASGSATAFSLDLCKKDHVERLLNEIKVIKLG